MQVDNRLSLAPGALSWPQSLLGTGSLPWPC